MEVRMGDAGDLAVLRKEQSPKGRSGDQRNERTQNQPARAPVPAMTMPWWCTLRWRSLLARAGAVMGAVLVAATTT